MFLGHPQGWHSLPGACRSSVYSWMRPGYENRGLCCDGSWLWGSSWANTCVCLKIGSAEEAAVEDGVCQAHVGNDASQPHPATLVQILIQSLPAPSQWPLSGHGSYWVNQIKEGRGTVRGAVSPYYCSNWTNNAKYLCSWSQEQSCFWSRETILAQKQLRRGSILFYLQLLWWKRKQLGVLGNSERFQVAQILLWIQVLSGSACLCCAKQWSLQVDPKRPATGLWSGQMAMESSKAVVATGDW